MPKQVFQRPPQIDHRQWQKQAGKAPDNLAAPGVAKRKQKRAAKKAAKPGIAKPTA